MSTFQGRLSTSTPAGGIWHTLNWLLFGLITVVVALIVGVRFLPVLSDRRTQQARLQQLTAEVEQERQSHQLNALEEEHLRTDPEYAALIARGRLGLAEAGETIYTFPRADRDGGATRGGR